MKEEALLKETPLTQHFIRTLHKTLLREDYTVYRILPGGVQTSYVIHAGQYKTRPNSVITRYGDRFEYATPEETPALMSDLVDWYNDAERSGKFTPIELAQRCRKIGKVHSNRACRDIPLSLHSYSSI